MDVTKRENKLRERMSGLFGETITILEDIALLKERLTQIENGEINGDVEITKESISELERRLDEILTKNLRILKKLGEI